MAKTSINWLFLENRATKKCMRKQAPISRNIGFPVLVFVAL